MSVREKDIMQSARRSILHGSEALKNLAESLDASFARAVEMILEAGGRLIVSGIGKSAHIAQKIVATMNSTGTPAVLCTPPTPPTAIWVSSKKAMW